VSGTTSTASAKPAASPSSDTDYTSPRPATGPPPNAPAAPRMSRPAAATGPSRHVWPSDAVTTAAGLAATEQEFFAALRAAGVDIRLRHSTRTRGEVTGYAVALPGHTTKDRWPCLVRRRQTRRRSHPAQAATPLEANHHK